MKKTGKQKKTIEISMKQKNWLLEKGEKMNNYLARLTLKKENTQIANVGNWRDYYYWSCEHLNIIK